MNYLNINNHHIQFTVFQHFKYQIILLINKNNLHIIKLIKSCGSCEHIQKSNYLKKILIRHCKYNCHCLLILWMNSQSEQECPSCSTTFLSFLYFDLLTISWICRYINLWTYHNHTGTYFARKTLNSSFINDTMWASTCVFILHFNIVNIVNNVFVVRVLSVI